MEELRIVGIDCATQPKKVGLSLGVVRDGQLTLLEAQLGISDDALLETLEAWLRPVGSVLLSLDAPLGWPTGLSAGLADHRAGQRLSVPPDLMFSRFTDHEMKRRLGKTSLEVGANLIARTAHAATTLLGDLRERTGLPIPLAWSTELQERVSAIEVYPAATLIAHGIESLHYKKKDGDVARQSLIENLRPLLAIECDPNALVENPDVLDASICVLAGADFLSGKAVPPANETAALREGWIWVPEVLVAAPSS